MKTKKFRALKDDMSNCRLYYGSLIYDKEGNPRIYDVDTNTFHTCIKGTEGQFTGLHDKNGKEIYEGDICNVLYTDWSSKLESDSRTLDEYLNSISKKAILVWDYNQYKFHFKNSNNTSLLGSTIVGKHGKIEVIGNIHENKELLNEKTA